MTEAEWLTSTDLEAMFEDLHGKRSPRLCDRKLRLFVCGCCHRVWDCLTDKRSRRSVEIGERFADRLESEKTKKISGPEGT